MPTVNLLELCLLTITILKIKITPWHINESKIGLLSFYNVYITIHQVSYSFKITQDGVAAVILGIEEEKDLSAWMNALITASVSKNTLSPPVKATKSLPRSMHSPWNDEGSTEDGSQSSTRRHTVGPSSKITKQSYIEIDIGTYEQPTDVLVR